MAKSDGQADRVQAPAVHVGGQSVAPRSAKVHPVHTGEVVTGDQAGRGSVPRSLRFICQHCRRRVHRQRSGDWYHDRNGSVSCSPGEGSGRRATPIEVD
jgi:hypothetical protein